MSNRTITEPKETENIYTPGKVLIVEDDLIMCRILVTTLDILGIRADVANSGKDALSKLDNVYKLIFMDIGLQDITGWHVIRMIRNLKSLLCDIPIIAMSAHANKEDINKNSEWINEFIQKPLSIKNLKETIKVHAPALLEQNEIFIKEA